MSTRLNSADKSIIRDIVGRLHVSEPDLEVMQILAARVPNASPALLRQVLAEAVKAHHDNQQLYRQVMGGRF